MKKMICLLCVLCAFWTVMPVCAAEEPYLVSAELPATHIPLSEKSQTITISLESVRTALEAYQEGLFEEIFPVYTNVYFYREDGSDLSAEGLSAYVQNENLTVRVSANTVIEKDTFHLGAISSESGTREDLRESGYNFTIVLSAGELMPVISMESPVTDTTVSVNVLLFEEVLAESFEDVFVDPSDFVLSDADRNILEGVSMRYTLEEGLQMTVAANTVVDEGKYYLMTDLGEGEYKDWRDYGFELYIVLSIEQPIASEYTAPDVVVESYALYTPVWLDGYADQLREVLGNALFDRNFKSGSTYKFKQEDGTLLPGISFLYAWKSEGTYEFQVLVYEEQENIESLDVQLMGFDWTTETETELEANIRLKLTLQNASQNAVKGELPETHLTYSVDMQTVEISTAELKQAWDFENPGYFQSVFADGAYYGLISEDKEDLLNVEMVYSAEKEALVATVYGETLVPEATFYLFDLLNFVDFRDQGFEISIVFSVTNPNGIAGPESDVRVYAENGTLVVEAEQAALVVTDMCGVQVLSDTVENRGVYPLGKGVYLVRINDHTVRKVLVE